MKTDEINPSHFDWTVTNNIATICLNRPDKKNALDFDVWFGIPDLIEEIVEKEEARCILLAGKGDAFLRALT